MKKQIMFMVCLLAGWAYAGETSRATLDEKAILNLAPRISLEEPGITSFLVEGAIHTGTWGWRFTAAGKVPDHVMVMISDHRDKTPLLMGADNDAMFYDPVAPKVLLGALVPQLYIRLQASEKKSVDREKKQEFVCGFAVKDRKDIEAENSELRRRSVLIDIPSILKGVEGPFSITSEDDRHFVAQATSERGGKAVVFLSPDREEGAFTRVELYHKEETNPFLTLGRIVLNQPIPDEYFIFPKDGLLNSGLTITNCPPLEHKTQENASIRMLHGFMAREVMAEGGDLKVRACVERRFEQKIDWEMLREKDAVNSAILRDLFPAGCWSSPLPDEHTADRSNKIYSQ
jgi:hypothetical protein